MEEEERRARLAQGLRGLGIDPKRVSLEVGDGVATLTGELDLWQQVVDTGHLAAGLEGVRHVVCDLTSPEQRRPEPVDLVPYRIMERIDSADVVIIGGGVTGCAIARQLSRYKLDILVVEREEDLSCGTTKSNNGMIHSGYDSKPHTLKAKLNVAGNAMYTQWADELGFRLCRTGSFVLAFDQAEQKILEDYLENGKKNGVPGISLLSGEEARSIEPGLSDNALWALWTPTAGYVEPYEVALALAENAVENGARFLLDCKVLDMERSEGQVTELVTSRGKIVCKHVINAAGLYADEIAALAGDRFYTIHPRRGTLAIFDKENRGKIHTFSGQAPGPYSKGGGPQETPEGTLLWGPSAKEVWDKEDTGVDGDDLDFVIEKGLHLVKGIDEGSLITYFSGNRAATYEEDFIIENSKKLPNFTHVAGIQSPGLASAPAIAKLVEALFLQAWGAAPVNPGYQPIRQVEKPFRDCSPEERDTLIRRDPRYAHVICRCETVTESEIVSAIHGPIPATNVDAVKRRTRAGMGRCQGGFCGARVLELLARELGRPKTEITLKGKGSEILHRENRGVNGHA